MTRRHHSPVIAHLIDGWDSGDNWGSAMSGAWAVAEVARAAGIDDVVAPILAVSWGPIAETIDLGEAADTLSDRDYGGDVSFETAVLADAYLSGRITDDDLIFAARVLTRYIDLCDAAGLSY